MGDKGLNLFDECPAECVYLYPQEKEYTFSSWRDSKMYTPSKFTDTEDTNLNFKNGAVAKLRILVKLGIL